MGIDRQRIVDNFYPAGSDGGGVLHPVRHPQWLRGRAVVRLRSGGGRALLAEAGFPDGFKTTITYRDVVRGYLPEPGRVAQDIQAQLQDNLNIDAEIVVMESGAFIDAANAGELEGMHLLGWGADYPHITNFLDYHFGGNAVQFGAAYPEIYEPAAARLHRSPIRREAEPLYARPTTPSASWCRWCPIAHGGSATAYRADVTDPQASPLTNEIFGRERSGRTRHLRVDAERRADQPVLRRMRPTASRCGPASRSCEVAVRLRDQRHRRANPRWPKSCDAERGPDRLDLHAAPGRHVPRRLALRRQRRGRHRSSPAVDVNSPLHMGNTGAFDVLEHCSGAT